MSFITQEQAEQILGVDFLHPAGDKLASLNQQTHGCGTRVGCVPDPIDSLLIDAACRIIKGIQAGVIYAGVARQTTN